MKLKSSHLKYLTVSITPATIALSAMIATPALAQVAATWTGTAGDNVYNTAGNWNPGAPTANGSTATWDGTQTGDLSIRWTGAIGGFGGNGAGLFLTGSQTGAVSLNNTANNTNGLGIHDITIDADAGAFTLGGTTGTPHVVFRKGKVATGAGSGSLNPLLTNNSINSTATIKSNVVFQSGDGASRALTFDGDGNWLVENHLVTANGGALTVVKNGIGTLTITNTNPSQNNGYTVNDGTLTVGGAGRLGGPSGVFGGTVAINGTLSYQSTAGQTISSAISGGGALTQGAGTLTITGNTSFSGTTTVTGGTMVLGGSGNLDASQLTINGASAKFVLTSSVASILPITLTQGTLDGTGSAGAVSVGNDTGGIITHGNGGTGALTIDSLTFDGAGSFSFVEDGDAGTPGVIVTGTLTAPGLVTVNASKSSWASGTTFDLVTFGSFGGNLANFTKGIISGVSVRQTADLILDTNRLSLQITGENPVWTGLDNGNWVIGSTGANGNWKFPVSGLQTDYIAGGDIVTFDDSVTTGTTAVSISAANVSPALATFNNSTNDYTVSGAFGIAAGSVIKTGTGLLTISTANTYIGGTIVSEGTLALSGAGTLGAPTGALTVNGSGIVNLGTTSQTLGAVSLAGTSSITNGTLSPNTLTATSDSDIEVSAAIVGSGSVVQSGTGSLTLSGGNTHTGGTTANSGTLILSGAGTLGATAGALNLNAGALDLGSTNQTVGTVTKSGAAALSNGTLAFSVFNDTHTVGTAAISANLTGSGEFNLTGSGGTTILTGTNDYTGPTLVKAGTTLRLGDGGTTGSLSPLSDITIENGGTFSINRSDSITQGVDFGLLTGGVQGKISVLGAGTTVFNQNNTYTAGGTMSAGSVVVTNPGALGTGLNGTFSITGGSLHLQNDISMSYTGAFLTHGEPGASNDEGSIMSTGNNTLSNSISFNNGGTGSVSNFVSLSGTLTLNGALNANAAGRILNFGGAGNVVVNGAINTESLAVSKSGPGTTTLASLSGNTYTGGTTIEDGTLRILGSNVGPILIDGDGAVLAGTGFISGNVTLSNGGIAPGDGVTPIGALTLFNDLLLSSGVSKFNFNLSSADNTSDVLAMNILTNGGGTVTFNFSGGKVGETYTLFEFASTDVVGTSSFSATGGTGTFAISDNTLTYTVATVEAPADFAAWSEVNAGGQTADLDFDNDGVSNGAEYFMGETLSSFTVNPGLVGGTVTWPKDPAYNGTYAVKTSPDLINWIPASPGPVVVGNTVQYTPGTGLGKVFIRLEVTPN